VADIFNCSGMEAATESGNTIGGCPAGETLFSTVM
jgi:hypothetical protein